MSVRRNSFDLLRLLAAGAVVVGHSYELSGHGTADPVVQFTGVGGMGSLGVSVFFAISGFLVTASFARRPNVPAYLTGRGLRLLPALAVVVLASALVIGPLATSVSLSAYFGSPATWLYVARNVAILPVTYRLPGVFAANPYPDAVNGSLWTLRLEVGFYLVVAVLGWRDWLGKRTLLSLAVVFALALITAIASHRLPIQATLFLRSGALFFLGGAAWAWFGEGGWRAPRLRLIAAGLALATLALAFSRTWGDTALAVLAPLPILALANAGWPGQRALARIGDLSYGLYLWAFPIQQLLVLKQPEIGVLPLLGETLLIALPLAWVSWHLVERPALALKPRVHDLLARFDQAPQWEGPASVADPNAPDVRIAEANALPSRDG